MSSAARRECFARLGWLKLGPDPALADWAAAVRPLAIELVPQHRDEWLRCGGTWFAGVNILPNDGQGRIPGGPALPAALTAEIAALTGLPGWSWDRAQISVCHPGYPRRDGRDSDAAFRYRRNRDAAHLDGLLPVGPDRRRHLREHHGFILGIPLVETSPDAAPLVIWEGSHRLAARAFREILAGTAPERWGGIDLTERYHALRREIFAACPRVPVHAKPGEAYLLHRHALHGIAPWAEGAHAPPEGRMIAYFRPDPHPGEAPGWWLLDEDGARPGR